MISSSLPSQPLPHLSSLLSMIINKFLTNHKKMLQWDQVKKPMKIKNLLVKIKEGFYSNLS
jgi:hypothetical protein